MICRICSEHLQKNISLKKKGRRAHLQRKKHIEAVKALDSASENAAPGLTVSNNRSQTIIPLDSEKTYLALLSIAERFQVSDSEDDEMHVEQLPNSLGGVSFGTDQIFNEGGEELLFSAGNGAQDATNAHLLEQMRNIDYYDAAGLFGRVKFASKSTIGNDDIDEYGDLTVTGIVASMRVMGEHYEQIISIQD
jgi:hypothetical protein